MGNQNGAVHQNKTKMGQYTRMGLDDEMPEMNALNETFIQAMGRSQTQQKLRLG